MRTRSALPLGLAFVLVSAASGAAAQPTFTVNSLLDVPGGGNLADGVYETASGNGVCTLRAAIMEANQVAGGGATIVVPAGVYSLSRPWASPDDETTGDLDLLAAATIERTIGGFTAAGRGNQTKLMNAVDVGLLPPGTRRLEVSLIAIRQSAGPYNDGYADDLSIVVPEPSAALAALVAVAALAVDATRLARARRAELALPPRAVAR